MAKKADPTRARLRRAAQAWHDLQLHTVSMALGSSWPLHQRWVEAELKERMHALMGYRHVDPTAATSAPGMASSKAAATPSPPGTEGI